MTFQEAFKKDLKIFAYGMAVIVGLVGFGSWLVPRPGGSPPNTHIAFLPDHGRTKAQRAAQAVWLVETPDSFGSAVAVKLDNKYAFLTAAHVTDGHTNVVLHRPLRGSDFSTGRVSIPARVSRTGGEYDFAVLEVDKAPEGIFNYTLELSKQDYPAVGTPVLVVGCPYGPLFPLVVSSGIVAAIGVQPEVRGWHWKALDYTDAVVWPGNSGGPVVADGKLIGILVGAIGPGGSMYVPVRQIRKALHDVF